MLPVCDIKSGINLLIFIINSPSPLRVTPSFLFCVISKSPDVSVARTDVMVPFLF